MTSETLKALLMVAMFGVFEAVMNFPSTRRLRGWLGRHAARLRDFLAGPPRALQPVKVRARHRKG